MSSLTTIDFHDVKLVAIPGDRPETTLVAIKPIVEGMGLDWSSQHRKIKGHQLLKVCMVIMTTQMPGDDQTREHAFLPLNRVPMWLMTIQPAKVPDLGIRAKVIEFQTEAADVVFNHFFGKALATGPHLTAAQTGGINKRVFNKALAPVIESLAAQDTPSPRISPHPVSGRLSTLAIPWKVRPWGAMVHAC